MISYCVVCNGSGLAFNSYIPRMISKMKGERRWKVLYQRVDCGACNGTGTQVEDSYLDNMLLFYAGAPTRNSIKSEQLHHSPIRQICAPKENKLLRKFPFFKRKKGCGDTCRNEAISPSSRSSHRIRDKSLREELSAATKQKKNDHCKETDDTTSIGFQTMRVPREIFVDRGRTREWCQAMTCKR